MNLYEYSYTGSEQQQIGGDGPRSPVHESTPRYIQRLGRATRRIVRDSLPSFDLSVLLVSPLDLRIEEGDEPGEYRILLYTEAQGWVLYDLCASCSLCTRVLQDRREVLKREREVFEPFWKYLSEEERSQKEISSLLDYLKKKGYFTSFSCEQMEQELKEWRDAFPPFSGDSMVVVPCVHLKGE